MATLYISEFDGSALPGPGGVPVAPSVPIATQTITISGTSTVCASAFDAKTRLVRLHTDAICSFKFAATGTPTAVTTEGRMAADQTEYFAVSGGAKVAAISNT